MKRELYGRNYGQFADLDTIKSFIIQSLVTVVKEKANRTFDEAHQFAIDIKEGRGYGDGRSPIIMYAKETNPYSVGEINFTYLYWEYHILKPIAQIVITVDSTLDEVAQTLALGIYNSIDGWQKFKGILDIEPRVNSPSHKGRGLFHPCYAGRAIG
jgi:hypothetical protein